MFHFKDVKSAVEFYKKYKYTRFMLEQEHPEINVVFTEIISKPHKERANYEDWLFNYCFGDVIKWDVQVAKLKCYTKLDMVILVRIVEKEYTDGK